ncbi:MAG: DNA polymerase [Thermodesulfovibrio sp.]|nr:DNA polymerase [Thermodesulfovibrio sp.]
MKCYWGGRREAFFRGLINSPVEIWDVKQMYPTMAKLPLPNKDTEWHFLEGSENLQNIIGGIGYVHCSFRFPETTEYPCLPVFDSRFSKLVFPLEGESWATTYELKLALKLGCEFRDVKAWVFYPTENERNHPLKQFMEYFTDLKNQNPEGSMFYETSKLLMNALIGKFCQRDPEYSIETYQNVLASLGYDYTQFQEIMKHLEYRQKFKNPINVGSSWSPEWSSLILGSSRAIISEIMNVSKAITGHTDSVIVFKGSKVKCEALDMLYRLSSDLEHKAYYDSDSFWICRSAVYSPLRNRVTIKPTHHGYPTDTHEDFGKIIEANLKAQKPVINECYKTHLTTPKEALRTGQRLSSQITKITKITWDWDYKRKLLNPHVNLWSEYSPSKPWKNVQEILQALNKLQPLNQKWKNSKPQGRPLALTKEQQTEILKLRKKGVSIRETAQELNLSKDSVHRFLKTVSVS